MRRPTKRQRLQAPPSWLDIESVECVVAALPAEDAQSEDNIQPTSSNKNNNKHKSDEKAGASSSSSSVYVTTPVACQDICGDVFFDRFSKEVLIPFHMQKPALSSSTYDEDEDELEKKRHRAQTILKQRLTVGINSTARALEQVVNHGKSRQSTKPGATQSQEQPDAPLLVVLIVPQTHQSALLWAHIPVLCEQCQTPLLVLSPSSSLDKRIGKAMGIGRTSVLAFLPRLKSKQPVDNDSEKSTKRNQPDIEGEANRLQDRMDSFVDYVKTGILDQKDLYF